MSDQTRFRKKPPKFEKRLYPPNSAQVLFLTELLSLTLRVCTNFSRRVYFEAEKQLRDASVLQLSEWLSDSLSDSKIEIVHRSTALAFHLKARELNTGIGFLGQNHVYGPAFGLLRVLFELLLGYMYFVDGAPRERLLQYRRATTDQVRKWGAHLKSSARISEDLEEVLSRLRKLNKFSGHWSGLQLPELADRYSLGSTYAALYRSSSSFIHSLDLEYTYASHYFSMMAVDGNTDEPLFRENYGLFSATDAHSLIFYIYTLGVKVANTTAQHFGIPLSKQEELLVERADIASDPSQTLMSTGWEDLRSAMPWMFGEEEES